MLSAEGEHYAWVSKIAGSIVSRRTGWQRGGKPLNSIHEVWTGHSNSEAILQVCGGIVVEGWSGTGEAATTRS